MSEDKSRFTDSGKGLTWLKYIPEPTPHEKPDTQSTITAHSEENS